MNKQPLLILLSATAIFTVSACTTLNPETGQREANRTGTGAAVGAATGAVAGVLIGDSKKAAIIGAGVGALGGAAVGAYMDKQEKALKKDLEGTDVEVNRVGDNITLNMPSGITFDTGKAALKPQFYPVLNDVVKTLTAYESTIIHVAGHTDSTGSDAFNQQLSVNRANSVSNYLIQGGVKSQRIIATGYGETLPIADNSTESGRQQNRRVEITLEPLTES